MRPQSGDEGPAWGAPLRRDTGVEDQWISSVDQPHVDEGHVLLYRGIQQEKTFQYPGLEQDLQQLANRRTWNRYLALQWSMLSDSTFRSIPSTTGPSVVKPR